MESHTVIQPLKGSERMVVLDFFRGIAIFGILIVNMAWYNAPLFAQMGDFVLFDDTANRLAHIFIMIFFESKFYPLFAILFGLGFYLFLNKAAESVQPLVYRYRLRLLYLLLFGVLHVVFFWHGDILIIYALFGFIMTWFYRSSDKKVIIWAAIFIVLPVILMAALIALLKLAMGIPEVGPDLEAGFREQQLYARDFIQKAILVYTEGSFSDMIRIRLTDYMHSLNGIVFAFPNVISLFLIGMYMGRKKVFRDLDHAVNVLRKVFYWCLPIAVIFTPMFVYASLEGDMLVPDWNMPLLLAGSMIGGSAQMLVYLYLLTLLYRRFRKSHLVERISKVGRMAFTNYLMQSIIVTTLVYGYGLGLYAQINYWQGILLAVAIYLLQLYWSEPWLRKYRFGPFEWLWRSMTYGKLQPIRKDNSAEQNK